ncbi:hypothetical protein MMC22_004780 [Lobaria immixta]|nr:hypothetical protein [Lobaria immixta]
MPFTSDIDDAQDVAFFSLPIGSTEAPVLVCREDLHSPKSHLPPIKCSRPCCGLRHADTMMLKDAWGQMPNLCCPRARAVGAPRKTLPSMFDCLLSSPKRDLTIGLDVLEALAAVHFFAPDMGK